MSPTLKKMERGVDIILCLARRSWRPVTCAWIALTMATHGVIIPLYRVFVNNDTQTDLTGLSLLITAIAAAFAVREWGKIKGVTPNV